MQTFLRVAAGLIASATLTAGASAANPTPAGGSDDARQSCDKNVVLMGYWPPTNEMLRPWSTNPVQNPQGWIGRNWRGYGVNVYAFFPEFPPDGDPSNDSIGSPGSVGSENFDLQVDFQQTSADFWRIVDEYQPQLLITTSRGGNIGWEVEAIEGGHGEAGSADPASDWRSDGYGEFDLPVESSLAPRSWAAISRYRQGNRLASQLPMAEIVAAAETLNLTSVAIDSTGTSGNYLSGFLGLHGLYYNSISPHNLAAGHIHVGRSVSNEQAHQLMVASLAALLDAYPVADLPCP